MKYFILSFFLYILSTYAVADDIHDYARGIELITDQQSAIYKVSLPAEVYQNITKNNLSDIRVFNQAYEPVPYLIQNSLEESAADIDAIELPCFPIAIDDMKQINNDLDITVSNEGQVISINSKVDKSTDSIINHYLIDVSHIDASIVSIDFQLSDNDSNYAKKFKLDYSNDLNQWNILLSQGTLTNLEYNNYSLKNTRVDLPNRKIKYIRFSWLEHANGLVIESVKANLKNQNMSNENIWSITKHIRKDNEEGVFEFDTEGIFNIDQVDIELPEKNTLIDVIIESRIDTESQWRRRASAVFYNLYLQGTQVIGKPVNIHPTTDRYWRVKLQSTDGIGQLEPTLKFAWRSNELLFLARGEGPYILAYGNANVEQASRPTSRLMNIVMSQGSNNEMVGTAETGKHLTFKGDAALSEDFILPWQRIVLWFVLIAGVIVIAVMVFRLSRQMRNEN